MSGITKKERSWPRGQVSPLLAAMVLTASQPAAAWDWDWVNPVVWAKEVYGVGEDVYEKTKDFLSDEVKGIGNLVWDVVTLDPKDAWNDIKDIWRNHVCGGFTVASFAIGKGVQEDFDDCEIPPHPVEPDVLAKLSLYIKSDLNSVRIHEGCKLDGDVVPDRRGAITFGEHIYFAREKYHPRDAAGFKLLAHELTHVLQYRKSDILIRSAWGIGILTLHETTLTSLMLAPSGTKFGSWTFNVNTDVIADIGNFNSGPDAEILILNDRGLAILGRRT